MSSETRLFTLARICFQLKSYPSRAPLSYLCILLVMPETRTENNNQLMIGHAQRINQITLHHVDQRIILRNKQQIPAILALLDIIALQRRLNQLHRRTPRVFFRPSAVQLRKQTLPEHPHSLDIQTTEVPPHCMLQLVPRQVPVAHTQPVQHLHQTVKVAQAEELTLILPGLGAHRQIRLGNVPDMRLNHVEHMILVLADAARALDQLVDVGLAA